MSVNSSMTRPLVSSQVRPTAGAAAPTTTLAPSPAPVAQSAPTIGQTVSNDLHKVESWFGSLFSRVKGALGGNSAPTGGSGTASPAQIAAALGVPAASFEKNWPYIEQALAAAGMTDKATIIAVLATIKTETGSFEPIPEYSSGAEYNGRSDLGNRPGTNDGVTYKGRGYIQLTGRANYISYGNKLGVDLVGNPNLALDPRVAAKVLVQYFKDHNISAMAKAGNWQGVRRAVNGGLNGWSTFIGGVNALQGLNLGVDGNAAPASSPAPAPQSSPAPNSTSGPGGTYTVQPGDSLSAIAQRTLGSSNRWPDIYNLNKDQISNPNIIHPGQVLKLPGAAAAASKPAPAPAPKPAPAPQPAAAKPAPAPAPAAPAAPAAKAAPAAPAAPTAPASTSGAWSLDLPVSPSSTAAAVPATTATPAVSAAPETLAQLQQELKSIQQQLETLIAQSGTAQS